MENDAIVLFNDWKEDHESLTQDEKMELYNYAKDAYYNGDEIMSDLEFDTLEKEVQLVNKGYVGSKNGNYTEKHSFIMGSLSKVQIKEDKKTNQVDWDMFAEELNKYLSKAGGAEFFETTPKLDGCSFRVEVSNDNDKAKLESCSTRGDGEYGTDIKHLFMEEFNEYNFRYIDECVADICGPDDLLCISGEVLIKKSAFDSKYQEKFTNPRSFVAGTLGMKWENKPEQREMAYNLHFVCYDYRLYNKKTGKYQELSWMNPDDYTYSTLESYLGGIGELPDFQYCQVHPYNGKLTGEELKNIYYDYDDYRKNKCDYALDGVVFKPECSARKYNLKARPVDSVAMKFLPMINTTHINNIIWNVGKTGEYTPVAIVDTFKLDGKDISKASLHNYSYIEKHQCGIGSEVRISLAGDIIPFVYEVVTPAGISNINLPNDGYIVADANSGTKHLMKKFTGKDEELNKFKASTVVLNINSIGPAASEELWYSLEGLYPEGLTNIIQLMNQDGYDNITNELGTGKSTENIIKGMKDYLKKMSLVELIASFCFKSCGKRASELCAKIISGIPVTPASMPAVAYQWAYDKNSDNYKAVEQAIKDLNIPLLSNASSGTSGRTAIIMTGSPADVTSYATKEQWLQAHPQYYETTSWKEVQILFTDDLDSTSGKMKKAQKAGVEIRLYENTNDMNTMDSLYEKITEETIQDIKKKNALW